jgi:GntR family transcriptional regulator/MocR family aminotransferase
MAERKKSSDRGGRREFALNPFWLQPGIFEDEPASTALRFGFQLGLPDVSQFPMDAWRRLSARTLRTFSREPSFDREPAGRPALREAIAKHVSFTRAVACSAGDITVTSGAQQAFDLLSRILVTPKRTVVAVEDPGYPRLRSCFLAVGAKVVAVPVDAEGLIVDRLPANTRVIYVTPSHQFPTGAVMSPRRRTALLEFAHSRNAVVIEDDYDSEFRFGARPLDALQTLDRSESVFYVGTFSKSLFPALRLGFVVAPAWAQSALGAAKQHADDQCPPLTQETLAAFIAEGHLARHVRRMRQVYSGRRDVLLDGLQQHFSSWLQPVPSAAGLHLAALTQGSVDVASIIDQARQREVGLYPLRRFQVGRVGKPGFVFGYGALPERQITEGLARLRRVFTGR